MESNIDNLRANSFDEFIGQHSMTARLSVHIAAAKAERRPIEHIFLTGPAGFGKTTLATIVSNEIEDPLTVINFPKSPSAMSRTLRDIDSVGRGIMLIDEIHAGSKRQQESLLPLLEFGKFELENGRSFRIPNLTVIGCTTDPERVITPLVDRFKIKPYFDEYSDDEMALIALSMAVKAKIDMAEDDLIAIGKAAGGVPRHISDMILAARALGISLGRVATATEVLEFCEISPDGLTRDHLQYLEALRDLDGISGIDRISSVMQRNTGMVKRLENLLFTRGFIAFGSSGRELTQRGDDRIR